MKKIGGLALSSCLMIGCNNVRFENQASQVPLEGKTLDSSIDRALDKTVQTDLNRSVDFSLSLESGAPAIADGFEGSFSLKGRNGTVLVAAGTVTAIDMKRLRFRFTPTLDFRGGGKINFYIIAPDGRYSQTEIRLVVVTAFHEINSVLAVRATGCIMCHANVKADVVTDFGYGDSYFLGQPFSGDVVMLNNNSVYGDHHQMWKSINLEGKVIVPDTEINTDLAIFDQDGKVSGQKNIQTTLPNYLRDQLAQSANASTKAAAVESYNEIFIGAPSALRIQEAFGYSRRPQPVKYIADDQSQSDSIGTSVEYNVSNRTAKIEGNLTCSGDLFINGSVKIKNLRLNTIMGCRIYSTESVFIEGLVEYVGNGDNQNLQISSARAIVMGMGHVPSPCVAIHESQKTSLTDDTLSYRLNHGAVHLASYTRHIQSTPLEQIKLILDDHEKVGKITEASCRVGGRVVPFERLLLNAPHVHSRYHGDFKGTVIAEIAIFGLQGFSFQFDEVFQRVPVLPMLAPEDYLKVAK